MGQAQWRGAGSHDHRASTAENGGPNLSRAAAGLAAPLVANGSATTQRGSDRFTSRNNLCLCTQQQRSSPLDPLFIPYYEATSCLLWLWPPGDRVTGHDRIITQRYATCAITRAKRASHASHTTAHIRVHLRVVGDSCRTQGWSPLLRLAAFSNLQRQPL